MRYFVHIIVEMELSFLCLLMYVLNAVLSIQVKCNKVDTIIVKI